MRLIQNASWGLIPLLLTSACAPRPSYKTNGAYLAHARMMLDEDRAEQRNDTERIVATTRLACQTHRLVYLQLQDRSWVQIRCH